MRKLVKAVTVAVASVAMAASATGGRLSSAAATCTETVMVKGRGVGADKTEALKDAYRDAVERAVGLYVDAEQMMKNEELVKDQILTQSNAYIEKCEVAKETMKPNGLVEIQILAEVRKTALTKKISDVMPTKTFRLNDGLKNEHAKMTTVEKRNVDGAALLANVLKDFDPIELSLDYSLASSEAIVGDLSGRRGNSNSGTVRVNYLFKAEIDEKRFFEHVTGRLTDVLEQISIDEPQDVTISLQARPISYVDSATKVNVADVLEKARATVKGTLHKGHFKLHLYENAEVKMPSQLGDLSRNRWAKEKQVVVVTKANKFKTVFSARLYKLDVASTKVFSAWRQSRLNACGKRSKLSIAFLDNSGEPLHVETIPLPGRSSIDDPNGCIFAPWFSWFSSDGVTCVSYDWEKFDLPKDVLPEVKDMKIEIAK